MSAFALFHRRRRIVFGIVLILVCVCGVSGCATSRLVKVRTVPQNPLSEKLKLSAWRGPKPSERTVQTLRRYDLTESGGDPSPEALQGLMEYYRKTPSHETCYAISELSYLAGKDLERSHNQAAMQHYFNCVLYSYEYLFHPRFADSANPYDPQFRGACDLYNVSLEAGLRQIQKAGQLKPGFRKIDMVGGREVEFSIRSEGLNWRDQEFDQFKFVSDYQLTGLTNKYRTHGLGVPMIAVRSSKSSGALQDKYYAPNLSFPITAFLRLKKDESNPNAPLQAELELKDPLEQTRIQVANYEIPLESDISTPLAYFLDSPKLKHLDTYGLVWADKAKEISGLYMVQPYQPGKIPVLMVHGLWSSPMTWMEMMNDLRGVPEIRDRYQFLFYLYPSGQPFWETTADLRDNLQELRTTFAHMDQEHELDEMVVVGHSMGGLVSRMLTSHGGDVYWNKISEKPIQQVGGSEESQAQLKRLFYFEPEQSIKRVVTIGSPNQGSGLANNFTQWLGRKLISLPGHTMEAGMSILTLDPSGLLNEISSATSIDSLSPKSPILQANFESKKAEWVRYHNVVGITSDKPLEQNSDGVVPYLSAHLDSVESEVVVHAEHSKLHRHPKTVLEVQRILLDHLQQVDATSHSDVIHAGQREDQLGGANQGHSLPRRQVESPEFEPQQTVQSEMKWTPPSSARLQRAPVIDQGEWSPAGKSLAP
ncbi:Alpha/beta hydrolase family protein [Polystyrenella longa]|uniref:Alpha/beta hydrolase family protein n=1 Tax=Polystyrenella longa TaxID=2528007 RepID=A0A518CJK9_9PLAN|nr:alpha/beta fold hydrolase [Polystyrenella longa]QDU79413.1 Alpha/beta hydrolase family protein [Polystyrenella longa]